MSRLTSGERMSHAREAGSFPSKQLVYSLTDVEIIVAARLAEATQRLGALADQWEDEPSSPGHVDTGWNRGYDARRRWDVGHLRRTLNRVSGRCSCGEQDMTSLNPAEIVVHRYDGRPCYIAKAVTRGHDTAPSDDRYEGWEPWEDATWD